MSKTILITGGCGFIGHHFVEHIIINTAWNIIILDKLTKTFGTRIFLTFQTINHCLSEIKLAR